MTLANPFAFVLSGGPDNNNPDASLGGEPSPNAIVDDSINNLFDDVSAEDAQIDHVDYRCFYVFNEGEMSLTNARVWITDDFEGGAVLKLGITSANEVQRLTISDTATGGSFVLMLYETLPSVQVDYNSDPGVWATNLQTALNLIITGVQVSAKVASGNIIFDVTFVEHESKRAQPTLTLVNNDLTPPATIDITVLQSGAPINTIAPDIGISTNPPGGVSFITTSSDSPLVFPRIYSLECFPLWIKRTIAVGTTATERDGVTIRFSAGQSAS